MAVRAPVSATRRSLAVLGVRVLGVVLNAALAIVLGRALGVEGLGVYAAVTGLAAVLVLPSSACLGPFVVRRAALTHAVAPGQVPALARSVARLLIALTVPAAALGLVVGLTRGPDAAAYLLLAPLVVLSTPGLLLQALQQGTGSPAAAVAPVAVVRPAVALAGALLVGAAMSPAAAVLLQVAGSALALLVALGATRRLLRGVRSARPAPLPAGWGAEVLRLGTTTGLGAAAAVFGVVVAGLTGQTETAGLLGGALRVSAVLALVVWATGEALQPLVAVAVAAGPGEERRRLQRTVTTTTRRVSAVTGLLAVGVAVAAPQVLGLLGPGFEDGTGALRLLCAAALVNALAASSTTLLTMGGHSGAAAVASAVGFGVTAAGTGLLLGPYGALGCAAALLAGTAVRNVVASAACRRLLGLDATVLGRRQCPAGPRPS